MYTLPLDRAALADHTECDHAAELTGALSRTSPRDERLAAGPAASMRFQPVSAHWASTVACNARRGMAGAWTTTVVAALVAAAGCGPGEPSIAQTCEHLEEAAAVAVSFDLDDGPGDDGALAASFDDRADAFERAAAVAPDAIAYQVRTKAEDNRAAADYLRHGRNDETAGAGPGVLETSQRLNAWSEHHCGFSAW